jgi:hypothetical protein
MSLGYNNIRIFQRMQNKPLPFTFFFIGLLFGAIQIALSDKIYNVIVNSPNTNDNCDSSGSHPQVVINTADLGENE